MESSKKAYRPAVESLESMLLLSTVVHADAKSTASAGPVVLSLHGTLHASGHYSSGSGSVSGSGNLNPVGATTFKLSASLTNPPSELVLKAKKGTIDLASAGPIVGTTGTYSVVGGTGAYAHASGSGTLSVSYSLASGNKVNATLKFS